MKVAIITNDIDWIIAPDPKNGGAGVVTLNFYECLKKMSDVEIVLIGQGDSSKNNSPNLVYIDADVESDEFITKLRAVTKDCDKVFCSHFSNIYQGVLLQSHTAAHRAKNSHPLIKPLKYLLYLNKIKSQQKFYDKVKSFYKIFAVSSILKDDYETNYGIKNIQVCYPGCKQVYDTFPKNNSERLTFGIVANSSMNKGGHYFIIAVGIAKILGLRCNLRIIAPKYYKDFFMKFLIKLFGLQKVVEILPKQMDMSQFYENIDCLVMPSVNEAFGLVALEAMSYGKCVLTSDTAGFCEIVDENSSLIFNRKSFKDFVGKLLYVGKLYYENRDRFDEICKNGYEISKNYTWERFTKDLLSKY